MSKHTPGPWRIQPLASEFDREEPWDHEEVGIEGFTLCYIAPRCKDDSDLDHDEWAAIEDHCDVYATAERLANARLIAAAPAMLEALRKAQQFISNALEFGYLAPLADGSPEAQTRADIDAAIRAATGEQT